MPVIMDKYSNVSTGNSINNKITLGKQRRKNRIITDIFRSGILSGNALKIIALITMTVDHIGANIFPEIYILRVIGRISFPIFACMIAEGCRYTRNKIRYFLTIFILGIVCQTVYYFAKDSLYQDVLITFSLAIIIIFAIQKARENPGSPLVFLPVAAVLLAIFLCEILPLLLSDTDYHIDYGFFGVMLPVLVSLGEKREHRFFLAFVGTAVLALSLTAIQWWGLLALIPIAFYSGERGKMPMKYLFYIYYPVHLVIIEGIAVLIKV